MARVDPGDEADAERQRLIAETNAIAIGALAELGIQPSHRRHHLNQDHRNAWSVISVLATNALIDLIPPRRLAAEIGMAVRRPSVPNFSEWPGQGSAVLSLNQYV